MTREDTFVMSLGELKRLEVIKFNGFFLLYIYIIIGNMKFSDLQKKMAQRLYFRPPDLHNGKIPYAHEIVQLSRWAREGKVVRLRKGLYTLGAAERKGEVSTLSLAEPLYRPSYLSLEWALSFYGILPEAVGTFTSVTSLKTARFQNALGLFTYRHLDPRFFFGQKHLNLPTPHWIARPEKALLDFIHLCVPRSSPLTAELFMEGYRFQNMNTLRKIHLKKFLQGFTPPRVQEGGKVILSLIHD